MHETAVVRDLVRQVEKLAAAERARRVVALEVWLGALSHLSPAHFRDHFRLEARGSVAAGAALRITRSTDTAHPEATGVVLRRIDVED